MRTKDDSDDANGGRKWEDDVPDRSTIPRCNVERDDREITRPAEGADKSAGAKQMNLYIDAYELVI